MSKSRSRPKSKNAITAEMDKLAEQMSITNRMPNAPGAGLRLKKKTVVDEMLPLVQKLAEEGRAEKLKSEFREYMEKANTEAIEKRLKRLKRLDNLNKSSPSHKKQPSPKKPPSPKKQPSPKKLTSSKKTPSPKKVTTRKKSFSISNSDIDALENVNRDYYSDSGLSDELEKVNKPYFGGGKKRRKLKTKKHKKKRKTRKNRKKS